MIGLVTILHHIVTKNINAIRKTKRLLRTHCPFTCKKCDKYKCTDSKIKFYLVDDRAKVCKWVKKKNKCDEIGDDLTCRKACGDCESY